MTSRLILDEFDLNLPSSCFLVRFWLILVVVVVPGTVHSVLVVDERVVANSRDHLRRKLSIVRCCAHIHGSLTLAHNRIFELSCKMGMRFVTDDEQTC